VKSNLRGLRGASEVASLYQEALLSRTAIRLIALVFYAKIYSVKENIVWVVKAQRRGTGVSRHHEGRNWRKFEFLSKLEGNRSLVTVFHLFMNQTEVRLVPMIPGKPWIHGKPLEHHSTMISSSFQLHPQ